MAIDEREQRASETLVSLVTMGTSGTRLGANGDGKRDEPSGKVIRMGVSRIKQFAHSDLDPPFAPSTIASISRTRSGLSVTVTLSFDECSRSVGMDDLPYDLLLVGCYAIPTRGVKPAGKIWVSPPAAGERMSGIVITMPILVIMIDRSR